jgi:hypothetical protein
LQAWSGTLFAQGVCGAWSFPQVLPLAVVSKFFSGEELNTLARILRDTSIADGRDGMFCTGNAGTSLLSKSDKESGNCSTTVTIYGSALNTNLTDLVFSGTAAEKVLCRPFPSVIGTAILDKNKELPPVIPPVPQISFRAAAVANMLYTPMETGDFSCSYKWKIGKLHWLPSIKKKKMT